MQGIFARLMTIHRPLISQLNMLLGEHDLSYSLWQVMYCIKAKGPSSLVEIASYYCIEKPGISRSVYQLEERFLVETIPSKDRREKVIRLSERGEELYNICRTEITKLEHSVMKDISNEAQQILFDTLPCIRERLVNSKER